MAPTQVANGSDGLPINPTVVLGENGNGFVTYANALNTVSFSLSTGSSNWNYQSYHPIIYLGYVNGGGLALVDSSSNVIPLNQNGNPGTVVALPTNSFVQPTWTGSWQGAIASSSIGSSRIQLPTMDYGHSFWGSSSSNGRGGGPSLFGMSVELPWYPHLPTCPGVQTPCAQESVNDALTALRNLISGNCSACVTNVFNKTSPRATQVSFYQDLMRVPGFYDGSRSYAPMTTLCDTCGFTGTVRDFFLSNPGASAVSQTPSTQGMLIYFHPSAINAALGSTPRALENQALLFHEGLHGATGYQDGNALTGGGLEGVFGICKTDVSFSISEYLGYFTLGVGYAPTYQNGCSTWAPNWP
jgi:hypothetical protein